MNVSEGKNVKISTKGRYALEAMTDLVLHAGDNVENIRSIAGRRHLSENYLEQIFLSLRKAKLVESIRGPQGGYKIAKLPSDVTASDILHAVEGQMVPVECLEENCKEKCIFLGQCATQKVWAVLFKEMETVLSGVTLRQLVDAVREEENNIILDYSI